MHDDSHGYDRRARGGHSDAGPDRSAIRLRPSPGKQPRTRRLPPTSGTIQRRAKPGAARPTPDHGWDFAGAVGAGIGTLEEPSSGAVASTAGVASGAVASSEGVASSSEGVASSSGAMASSESGAMASTSGAPLPSALKQQFETSLGEDLSGVRVHTDDSAAAAADSVGALAFAHGQDIYFNAGEYQPDTADGAFLLAHEVAHTVQQGTGVAGPQHKLEVSEDHDPCEAAADDAAVAMMLGRPASVDRQPGAAGKINPRRVRVPWGSSVVTEDRSYLDLNPRGEVWVGGRMVSSIPVRGTGAAIQIQAGTSGVLRVAMNGNYSIDNALSTPTGTFYLTGGMSYQCDAAGNITWTTPNGTIHRPPRTTEFTVSAPTATGSGNDMAATFTFTGSSSTGASGSVTVGGGPVSGTATSGSRSYPAGTVVETITLHANVIGATAQASGSGGGSGGANADARAQAQSGDSNARSNAQSGDSNARSNAQSDSQSGAQSGDSSARSGDSNSRAEGGRGGDVNVTIQQGPQQQPGQQPPTQQPTQPPAQQVPLPRPLPIGFEVDQDAAPAAVPDLMAWGRALTQAQVDAINRGDLWVLVHSSASRSGSADHNQGLVERRAAWVARQLRFRLEASAFHARPYPEGYTQAGGERGPDGREDSHHRAAMVEVVRRP